MKGKTIKMMVFTIMIMLMSFITVDAKSQNVTDQATLKEALNDNTVDTIVLANDIETTEKINITRAVTIDGAGNTIKYVGTFKGSADNTTWAGIYVLHVYRTTVTIKNVTLTGGNAALNVNGSRVTLEGNIDVSGNGFGGIELSKGNNVTEYPYVDATKATLKNNSEDKLLPTVWIDGITPEEIEENDVDFDIDENAIGGAVLINSNGQFQFYLEKDNTPTGDDIINLLPEEETTTPEKVKDTTASKNPNTYDKIIVYCIVSILGALSFGYCIKKVASR